MSAPKTHSPVLEVWYYRAWGTLHVLLGILFSVVFILGAFIPDNLSSLAYLILSFGIVYMGIVRLRKPYLICYDKKISVTGMFGGTAHEYTWEDEKDLVIAGNRLFLKKKKLRFNYWFTNQNQYQNMIRFYSGSASLSDELQD
jgi:hypothetical protein